MAARTLDDLPVSSDLQSFLAESVAAGAFRDPAEAVEAGLALLRERRQGLEAYADNWPPGGGECGRLIRERDWSATPLGPMESWTPQLRTTVANVVNSPVPKVLMWGPDHIMLYNDGYIEIAGQNHPDALGGSVPKIWPEIWDWNRKVLAAGFRGEVTFNRDQPMVLYRNGEPEEVVFDLFYTPVHDADGRVGGVMCTVLDNTEKVTTQKRLAQSEAEMRTITDALPVLISYVDKDHRYRFANSFYEEWLGQSPEAIVGRHVQEVVGAETYESRLPLMTRALSGEAILADTTMPHHVHGQRRAEVRYIPRRDAAGEVEGFYVLVFDVEERAQRAAALEREVRHRQRAEDQLRQLNENLEARVADAIEERRQAEAALTQAQKMESIGKLTGGIAHDFNNLLQVISGNLQLLARDVAGSERAERRVSAAMAGVSRGAKLAAQLLAFGRRQALEPKVINPTRFVREMDEIVRRAIGDGVEVETIVAGGLWNTFADPVQIENALLNLAINARDAMGGQGKLTIELGNASLDDAYARTHDEVTPGQYVMLAVSDTGCGMTPEIMGRVFEPFFSTKGEGKGSGLGLSMVYGFVKQSGGHVKIYSEVGEGTTIKLYLPRANAPEDVEVVAETGPAVGGQETVLVVEDDAEVRGTVVEMLTDLGYRVLKASDAQSALSVIESGIAIDLLFTDVVMPGPLRSPELARQARERLPHLAVLFTSGYTENAIVHGGRLDAGVELLPKPYTREALARKFRHVLANQRQRGQAREALPGGPRNVGDLTTILLVEDDDLIRFNTADMLKSGGYVVLEAVDGEDALTLLRTTPVDVLVTDVNLPGLSGPELVARAREVCPDLGVVYATGDISSVSEADSAQVLAKPYDLAGLVAAVQATPRGRE